MLPAVSVVMPVRNEERHLADSVACVLEQEYPGGFELVLAVGPSKDRTEAIARELAAADSRITVVPNPSGQIASAMNAAVKAARYPIITRIDGHALLPDGYLRTAVQTLLETGAADVGGVMAAEGVTPFQQAVAWAMTSPAGMGAAANHTGGQAGPVDTVYLGVYRRQAIEQVGGYDETMLIAEDWELNHRIKAAGHLIWFTPELRVTYRPRASLAALAKQHFRYGRWRRVVARRYPETVNLRYLAAPVATAVNATGLLLGLRRGHRGGRRGGRVRALPRLRSRRPPHLRGRGHRGRGGVRERPARRGAGPGPAGARRHAHVLGRRVPHQPAAAGEAALDRGGAAAGNTMRQWVLISAPNSRPCAARATTCTAST